MDRYISLRLFDCVARDVHTLWRYYALQGLFLILWGIAIIIWPELLIALIGALFITAGLLVLLTGWRLRRIKQRYNNSRYYIFDE